MESAAADYLKSTFSLTFSLNSKTEFVSLYVWTRMDDELDYFVQTGPLFYCAPGFLFNFLAPFLLSPLAFF